MPEIPSFSVDENIFNVRVFVIFQYILCLESNCPGEKKMAKLLKTLALFQKTQVQYLAHRFGRLMQEVY